MNVCQCTSHRHCDLAMHSKRVQNSKTFNNRNRGIGTTTRREVLQTCIELHGVALLVVMGDTEKGASTGMCLYGSVFFLHFSFWEEEEGGG